MSIKVTGCYDPWYTNYGTQVADDIVLLSNNEKDLQDGLQALHTYCVKNRLTVNTAKLRLCTFQRKLLNLHLLRHIRINLLNMCNLSNILDQILTVNVVLQNH